MTAPSQALEKLPEAGRVESWRGDSEGLILNSVSVLAGEDQLIRRMAEWEFVSSVFPRAQEDPTQSRNTKAFGHSRMGWPGLRKCSAYASLRGLR
jgi:hypothetical protein